MNYFNDASDISSDSLKSLENNKIKAVTKDSIINLVLQTLEKDKQVLIFNNSKRSSEATAEKIADVVPKSKDNEILQKLSQKILKALSSPTKQCKRLAKCVEKGIAFHHSGLVSKQRTLIEESFKKGLIKVISSTPTLAAGLNLPAYKVIVKDYKRYSSRGMADIPILEYHQMSGRAGRPGKEKVGKAVLHIKSDNEKSRVIPKYIFGKPEEILSKLAIEPILKMYVLSLIAMDMINSEEEIKSFFKSTLYAHQFKDLDTLYYNVFRIIGILKDYKFVMQDDNYYVATQLGKKISTLYLNPDTANYFYTNLDKFIKRFKNEQKTHYDIYSLINFVVNTQEMKPLFRISKLEEEDYVKKASDYEDKLVLKYDPFETEYETYMNSFKTSDIFLDWIFEISEDVICDKYNITPGELHYKLEVIDWLLYCIEELTYLKREIYFKNYLNKLRKRFKFGIRSDLLPLISLKGIGRIRARKLHNKGIKKIQDIRDTNLDALTIIVGENIAKSIKEQVKDEKQTFNKPLKETPKEIENRQGSKEVTSKEVDDLIASYNQYEEDKKEKDLNLTDYF